MHNLALWHAIGDSAIRLVGVRHEQTAAYAADGYARASGRLGVALTTTGPGAANTLAAVGEAWASRQPTARDRHGRPHLGPPARRLAGVAARGDGPGRDVRARDQGDPARSLGGSLGAAVTEAARLALAPSRRPVYLEVPTDLLSAEVDEPASAPAGRPPPGLWRTTGSWPPPSGSSAARRPLIWAGGGALQAGAGEAVAQLAERLVAPVVTTYSAHGLLPPDHPCLVAAPPHVPAVGALWDEADAGRRRSAPTSTAR